MIYLANGLNGAQEVATERYLPQPPSPQMVIEILSSIVGAHLSLCEVRERMKMENGASAVDRESSESQSTRCRGRVN